MKFEKGNIVVMHSCMESGGKNEGKLWECRGDSFNSSSGNEVVFLKGFSGYFCCEFLQKINEEALQELKSVNTSHNSDYTKCAKIECNNYVDFEGQFCDICMTNG